jgi:uncharacterized DUF497 family protein
MQGYYGIHIYEWDEEKDRLNRLKHGLALKDGIPVFRDFSAIELLDPETCEERFIRIGLNPVKGVLVVVYCERHERVIRLISVRRATKNEESDYEEGI